MSSGLAKDYYTSVIEFICNGHDAGAHKFSVVASIDQLVMEDDGTGMDKKTIHNFFTKGTDYKRVNVSTAEGRQMLGRFGLATLLLRHLGDAYRLETWRNGRKITIRQDFARNGWKRPETELSRSDEQSDSGTRITITKPRYQFDSEEFNIDRLMSEIAMSFPPLPDFTITLNGKTVPKRATVANGTEYDVTAQIIDRVRIAGSIFYNTHHKLGKEWAHLNAGIILTVNGRRVGDPQDFGLAGIDSRFPGNILGLIEVYGLSDRIRFDRSGFLRTPSYLKIKEHIYEVLQSIRTDLDSGNARRDFTYSRLAIPYIEQSLDAVTVRLNAKLKLKGHDIYTLEFDTGKKSGPLARVDPTGKFIYINQANPQLIRHGLKRVNRNLENMLLMAAIVALAEYEISQNHRGAASAFSKLDRNIARVASSLFENYKSIQADLRTVRGTDDITPAANVYLNPYRLYGIQEIVYATGWDQSTIRLLFLSGVLDVDRHDDVTGTRKMRGDKVRTALQVLEGYIPAAKLADPDYWNSGWRFSYNFKIDRALASRQDLPDYLKDIGKTNPFLLVRRGFEGQFLKKFRAY